MANIVRCELPDGVQRFKPFTVEDYRDFLLVRNDMNTKPAEEQKQLITELMNDYFGDYPAEYHPYIFLKVFLSSIGKTKIPVRMKCPICGKYKQYLFSLQQPPLNNPEVSVAGLTLKFKKPLEIIEDTGKMILDHIVSVSDSEGEYAWDDLNDSNKLTVIDAIDVETLEQIIAQMKPFNFELKTSCCDKTTVLKYDNIVDIFKLLLHPDEIFTFYQINHRLVSQGKYDLNSIMRMLPIERGITLSLIEKDLKS